MNALAGLARPTGAASRRFTPQAPDTAPSPAGPGGDAGGDPLADFLADFLAGFDARVAAGEDPELHGALRVSHVRAALARLRWLELGAALERHHGGPAQPLGIVGVTRP